MRDKKLIMTAFAVAGLLLGGAAFAQQMPPDLKAIWNTLTPAEQAAYEALMPQSPSPNALDQRTPGDTCGAATLEISALPFIHNNTTVGQGDDYLYGAACGGFNASSGIGPDVAYVVRTDITCDVNVDMDPAAADLALWVVTDCADPVGGCIGGDDSGGNGTAEQVAFTATGGTDYFIVVDGFGGASDSFVLTVTETGQTGCSLVPVELQGFSIE